MQDFSPLLNGLIKILSPSDIPNQNSNEAGSLLKQLQVLLLCKIQSSNLSTDLLLQNVQRDEEKLTSQSNSLASGIVRHFDAELSKSILVILFLEPAVGASSWAAKLRGNASALAHLLEFLHTCTLVSQQLYSLESRMPPGHINLPKGQLLSLGCAQFIGEFMNLLNSSADLAPSTLVKMLEVLESLLSLMRVCAPSCSPVTKGTTQGSVSTLRSIYKLDPRAVNIVLDLALLLVEDLTKPPKAAYSELGGAPKAPSDNIQKNLARGYDLSAAASIKVLCSMLPLLPLPIFHTPIFHTPIFHTPEDAEKRDMAPDLTTCGRMADGLRSGMQSEGEMNDGHVDSKSAGGVASGKGSSSCTGSVLIEEICVEQAASELQQQRAHDVLLRMVLLSCKLAPDRTLFTPWAEGLALEVEGDSAAAAAAADLLQKLAYLTSPVTRGLTPGEEDQPRMQGESDRTGSLALLTSSELMVQGLLYNVAEELLPQLRRALIAAQPQYDTYAATSPAASYCSPSNAAATNKGSSAASPSLVQDLVSTFERAVASRAIAFFVRALKHPFLGVRVPVILPALLAVLDDPSSAVCVHGVRALQHLAQEALPSDIAWQRELLLTVCNRLVVGCDELMWDAVIPATIATVSTVEGRDPYATGYHMLASELLLEAERHIHTRTRRLTFLVHFPALVKAIGLSTLRHLSRLMPLLLECLQAFDAPSRAAASALMLTVLQETWQRQQAHAAVLLMHLVPAYQQELRNLGVEGSGVEDILSSSSQCRVEDVKPGHERESQNAGSTHNCQKDALLFKSKEANSCRENLLNLRAIFETMSMCVDEPTWYKLVTSSGFADGFAWLRKS
ncbi:hypothetical protein CEUSTIGMA_g9152.t1 [Chlamydomonas eustigma]|uniref:Uncharacterized protein n=1 Tax=Chlamydomonas eustigma TaxID=1157962 RepID=A0A250XF62_9CHLO|nr:hypothetical protein CEUSTIGMA_g9152.t1 [Chlamydomonas eustigma]|eukprot:GAX81724.1 hypothetical protein CEUSTIGMA_g9152.t1 [Chlamydomonas eustigma]